MRCHSSTIRYTATQLRVHQESIQKYEVQLALLEMAGTELSKEKRDELREHWGFPPEPSYRDVFVTGDGPRCSWAAE